MKLSDFVSVAKADIKVVRNYQNVGFLYFDNIDFNKLESIDYEIDYIVPLIVNGCFRFFKVVLKD